jgi:hypothetical protein
MGKVGPEDTFRNIHLIEDHKWGRVAMVDGCEVPYFYGSDLSDSKRDRKRTEAIMPIDRSL